MGLAAVVVEQQAVEVGTGGGHRGTQRRAVHVEGPQGVVGPAPMPFGEVPAHVLDGVARRGKGRAGLGEDVVGRRRHRPVAEGRRSQGRIRGCGRVWPLALARSPIWAWCSCR